MSLKSAVQSGKLRTSNKYEKADIYIICVPTPINFTKQIPIPNTKIIFDVIKEISKIITRFSNNKYEIYEPIENTHQDQILKHSKIPADIDNKIFNQSKDWAISIAEELKYVGTLCVEFFIDKNDNLYVNEIAPRVHNSGHLNIIHGTKHH